MSLLQGWKSSNISVTFRSWQNNEGKMLKRNGCLHFAMWCGEIGSECLRSSETYQSWCDHFCYIRIGMFLRIWDTVNRFCQVKLQKLNVHSFKLYTSSNLSLMGMNTWGGAVLLHNEINGLISMTWHCSLMLKEETEIYWIWWLYFVSY